MVNSSGINLASKETQVEEMVERSLLRRSNCNKEEVMEEVIEEASSETKYDKIQCPQHKIA